MKTYKTEEYSSKREVLVSMVCDLCGKETKNDSWGTNRFDVKEIEISFKDGYRYPDNGNYVECSYDICPDCFMDRLVPFMESGGAKLSKKELEW